MRLVVFHHAGVGRLHGQRGRGAHQHGDGAEGCGANMSYLKNTPVEMNEAEVPIRIRRYGLVPDSGGAGLYRGGSALEMEFQVFAPQTMVTARNRDRSVFSAWGLRSGGPGRVSRFARNPGTPDCAACAWRTNRQDRMARRYLAVHRFPTARQPPWRSRDSASMIRPLSAAARMAHRNAARTKDAHAPGCVSAGGKV